MEETPVQKIEAFEPLFFLFFCLFHLHRVWALADRISYAAFWLGVLERKGWSYFALMEVLAAFCVRDIAAFFKKRQQNAWWRYIYLFGGSYLLFDLFAIAAGLPFWYRLLLAMFDVNAPYWGPLWGGFIGLGAASFALGCVLLWKRSGAARRSDL